MAGRSGVLVPGPLGEFVEGFLAELAGFGYSPRGCESQLGLTRHLSRWLTAEGLAAGDLTGDVVERFVAARRAVYSSLRSPRALVPLLSYLRTLGVAPAQPAVVAVTAAEVALARFAGYLSAERGLAPATVASYLSQVRPFLVAYPGDLGGWVSLTPRQVTAFVTGRAVGSVAEVGAGGSERAAGAVALDVVGGDGGVAVGRRGRLGGRSHHHGAATGAELGGGPRVARGGARRRPRPAPGRGHA